jgi:DNA polymerase-3 subunit gamma/tau
MDVIEMDAASHTGVDDIRELIEAARYRPSQARYKVYIIDEAHMLSKSAFNALLKTLETPPGYVKFIFATTEIRKIPQTVLSRCMRFDLCRIGVPLLVEHFQKILAAEGVDMSEEAVRLIAQSADGSARDGLSLLDQAMTLGESPITHGHVRHMLGLSDQTHLLSLYDTLLQGKSKEALDQAEGLYQAGSEALTLLQELMALTHQLTLFKATGQGEEGLFSHKWVAETAPRLSMPVLTRFWQMLLKGHEEIQRAPMAREAFDMLLIRLAYVRDLPTLSQGEGDKEEGAASGGAHGRSSAAQGMVPSPAPLPPPLVEKPQVVGRDGKILPQTFPELIQLIESQREPLLRFHLVHHVRFIRLEGVQLEIQLETGTPSSFIPDLKRALLESTGKSWQVILHTEGGAPTVYQKEKEEKENLFHSYSKDPWVHEVLTAFPGSTIDFIHIAKESQ